MLIKFTSGHVRVDSPCDIHGVDVQYSCLIGDNTLGMLYVDTRRTDITEKITSRNDIHVNVMGPDEKGKGWGGKHALGYFTFMFENGQFIKDDHSAYFILF